MVFTISLLPPQYRRSPPAYQLQGSVFYFALDVECHTVLDTGCRTVLDTGYRTVLDTGCRTVLDTGCRTVLDTGCHTVLDTGCKSFIKSSQSFIFARCHTALDAGCDSVLDTGFHIILDTGCHTDLYKGGFRPFQIQGFITVSGKGCFTALDIGVPPFQTQVSHARNL